MVALSHLLLLAVTATATSTAPIDDDAFLLSPAHSSSHLLFYTPIAWPSPLTLPSPNSHASGTALTLAKASQDVCDSVDFLTAYANCLQCSGADNEDIWRYYGRGLSPVGEACGLETEPKEGEQPGVAEAPKVASASAGTAPTSHSHVQETPAPSVSHTEHSAPSQTSSGGAGYQSPVIYPTGATGTFTHYGNGTASFTIYSLYLLSKPSTLLQKRRCQMQQLCSSAPLRLGWRMASE